MLYMLIDICVVSPDNTQLLLYLAVDFWLLVCFDYQRIYKGGVSSRCAISVCSIDR